MADRLLASAAWIITGDPDLRDALVRGLSAAGLGAVAIPCPPAPDGKTDLRPAIAAALAGGRPSLVVISLVPSAALVPQPVAAMDRAGWDALTADPVRALFQALQALLATLGEGPLSVVLLGPSVGHVGAAGLVALATLLEAQRGAMKAVARQLGTRGITVNWMSVAPEAFSPALATADLPRGPELGVPDHALGRVPSLAGEIVPALALLASPGAAAMTGLTLNLDGGEWMLP